MSLKRLILAVGLFVLISSEFNRFMHGVVIKQVHKFRFLKIAEIGVLIRPFYLSHDTLKQVLKYCDYDYPRKKDGTPLSYTEIREADFLSHIAFIERICAENGYELEFTKELENAK